MKNYFAKIAVFVAIITSCLTSCNKDSIGNYPNELTVDNWEAFVHAPNEIIEDLMDIELKKRQRFLASKDKYITNSRMIQSGKVRAWVGMSSATGSWVGVSGVSVSTTNNFTTTNANGDYTLNTGTAPVCMEYTASDLNGISPLDMVIIQRHIQGIDPFQHAITTSDAARRYVAADIDHNGTINRADITLLRKIILGTASFSGDNIIYIPESILTLPLVTNPTFLSSAFLLDNCKAPVHNYMARYAIKIGDVSGDFSF